MSILKQVLIKILIKRFFVFKQLISRNKKQKKIKLLELLLELKSVNCTTLLIFFLNILVMRTL